MIKINALILIVYLVIYSVAKLINFELFFYFKALLGIVVFFMAGFNCAILIKEEFKLDFDLAETLMIAVIISLFFIPLFIFLLYQITGTVASWLNILTYLLISSIPLIFLAYRENAKRKN